ncbi:MAG TPA: hypothetical protein VGE45_05110 [Chloroflexia bacterium]
MAVLNRKGTKGTKIIEIRIGSSGQANIPSGSVGDAAPGCARLAHLSVPGPGCLCRCEGTDSHWDLGR